MTDIATLFASELTDLGMDTTDVESLTDSFSALQADTPTDSSDQIAQCLADLTKARLTIAFLRTKYRRLKKRAERAKDLAWHTAGKIHGSRSADRNTDEAYTTALTLFHHTETITRALEDLWFTLLGRHTELKETSATYRKEMELGL